MSYKRYQIPDLGTLSIYKRKGAKAIKMSLTHENEIKVTIPSWTPYQVAVEFVKRNRGWVDQHKSTEIMSYESGLRVGKAHKLRFIHDPSVVKVKSRISLDEVKVYLPLNMPSDAPAAQLSARTAILRTLRKEAEKLLPQRLEELARRYNFSYKSISVKQLKSRWGSCNSFGDITLNFYLMQLPWEMIDYVILHELTHTKVLAHGKKFWDELGKVLPEVPVRRKQIMTYKPIINTNLGL